jgi:hypothetical protein
MYGLGCAFCDKSEILVKSPDCGVNVTVLVISKASMKSDSRSANCLGTDQDNVEFHPKISNITYLDCHHSQLRHTTHYNDPLIIPPGIPALHDHKTHTIRFPTIRTMPAAENTSNHIFILIDIANAKAQ